MGMTRVMTLLVAASVAGAMPAEAQEGEQERAERPATASYWGDTGLWFVPTAEVVRSRGWSFSLYRTEFDFRQGATDVSDWPLTVAVSAGPRTEIFGALRAVTRIDRDLRPLFSPSDEAEGGLVNDYPFVRETWTGNHLGDLLLGAKVNLLTERTNRPFALAVRGTVKLPTADDESGAGTGKADYFTDVVVSKEVSRRVEITGYTGYVVRGDPADLDLSNGVRWGLGAAFGARANLRLTAEIFGEHASDNSVRAVPGIVTGIDGSLAPVVSHLDSGTTTAIGLTWQHSNGVSLGAGLTYQFGLDDRGVVDPRQAEDNGHAVGMQFRLGFHRGVGVFRPPTPPVAAAPEPPPAPPVAKAAPPPPVTPPANRPPNVKALCDPCRLEVGRTSSIRADAQDPDGDSLSYRWTTAAGTLVDPRALSTQWRAETVPSTVPLTVTVDDGRGGVASATVAVEVISAPVAVLSFEDVHFDLDQHALRPDARATLDRAATALRQNPAVRLVIEGHASEEATEEYNRALGERRAGAVRDYLVSHGIDASRLDTVSYGETRPRHDNSREETRRLNRRAALVVNGQNAEDR